MTPVLTQALTESPIFVNENELTKTGVIFVTELYHSAVYSSAVVGEGHFRSNVISHIFS